MMSENKLVLEANIYLLSSSSFIKDAKKRIVMTLLMQSLLSTRS